MLTKENGETYARNVVQLSKELKSVQDAVDAKDRAYNTFVQNSFSQMLVDDAKI